MIFPSDIIVHFKPNEKGTEVTMSGLNELIRCQYCKYNKSNEWVDCPIAEFFGKTLDNYCSMAERKEE